MGRVEKESLWITHWDKAGEGLPENNEKPYV